MAWYNFSKKNTSTEPTVVRRLTDGLFFWGGRSVGAPSSHLEMLQVSTVYAAVKVISEDLGKLPISIKRVKKINGVDYLYPTEHPLQKLLTTKPNSWQTPTEFMRTIITSAALGKGSLSILLKDSRGVVQEIIPVPSTSWTQEVLDDASVRYRVRYANGTEHVFRQDQVLFIRGSVTLDGYSSVSTFEVAHNALSIIRNMEKQQVNLAANNGRPPGIVTFENEVDPDQVAELASGWKTKHGPNGDGETAFLPFGVKYTPLTMSLADAQFVELRKFQEREIARYFRVHPSLLFIDGATSYASSVQAAKEHWQNCLTPWAVEIEQALRRDILGNDPDYVYDFDEKELLRGDNLQHAQYLKQMLGAGGSPAIISINEARYELGMPPIEGEDYEKPLLGGYQNAKIEDEADKEGKSE